jgi:hypothetical protein
MTAATFTSQQQLSYRSVIASLAGAPLSLVSLTFRNKVKSITTTPQGAQTTVLAGRRLAHNSQPVNSIWEDSLVEMEMQVGLDGGVQRYVWKWIRTLVVHNSSNTVPCCSCVHVNACRFLILRVSCS